MVIQLEIWRELERNHQSIVQSFTVPFRDRRSRGISHPVYDFLFTYYAFPPGRLEQWHPAINVILEAPQNEIELFARFINDTKYAYSNNQITLKSSQLKEGLKRRLPWVIELLTKIENTPARFGCYALHEWAMVYKLPEERRHTGYPLRVAPAVIESVVDTQKLRCTHFDAYRFFTPEASPQNLYSLRSESRLEFEQGGCIHASMDLYKWAFLFAPWVGSELLRECFLLAIRARELDMRSSPYELSALGFFPIPIETESGRNEFVKEQKDLANAASAVRQKLRAMLIELLSLTTEEGLSILAIG